MPLFDAMPLAELSATCNFFMPSPQLNSNFFMPSRPPTSTNTTYPRYVQSSERHATAHEIALPTAVRTRRRRHRHSAAIAAIIQRRPPPCLYVRRMRLQPRAACVDGDFAPSPPRTCMMVHAIAPAAKIVVVARRYRPRGAFNCAGGRH